MNQEMVSTIAGLLGGLAVFIYGMNLMSEGLQKAAGEKMKKILSVLTKNPLVGMLAGALVTAVLQSSSATTVMVIGFVSAGLMSLPQAISIILGANIGTTITANIAAAVGNTNAKRAALAHTVFNVFGVIWAVALFHPFGSLIHWIIDVLGLSGSDQAPLYGISMLHTVFNLINTSLLIWFIPLIEKFVCLVIKDKKGEEQDRLVYINAGLISTPELAISEADKEVVHFGKIMQKGLGYIRSAVETSSDEQSFRPFQEKLVKYEEISDRIEYEVVGFLNKVSPRPDQL